MAMKCVPYDALVFHVWCNPVVRDAQVFRAASSPTLRMCTAFVQPDVTVPAIRRKFEANDVRTSQGHLKKWIEC